MFVNIVDLDFYFSLSPTLILLLRMFVTLSDEKRWGRVASKLSSFLLLLLRRTLSAQPLSVFRYVSFFIFVLYGIKIYFNNSTYFRLPNVPASIVDK